MDNPTDISAGTPLGLNREDTSLDWQQLAPLVPRDGRYPVLPRLTPQQELALLCRTLFREGYNDHIAGHITYRQPDGTLLLNPWELTWDEVTASDIVRLDHEGNVLEGDWNITPAINVHVDLHALRHDIGVAIHNHSEWGSVWAGAGRVPPIYDQTSAMVDGDPILYDEYRGTVEDRAAGRSAVERLSENKWALLANHGVFVVGKDIRQAHLRAITLEWRCRLAWRIEALGGGTPVAPETAEAIGARTDRSGFPFLWEAMARREIRRDPGVLE
ncbi:putative aldolase [Caenibius tardaugens NBRC 16725]|uniref:Putative aldolase n=1 Tax=Caenibius tardaugens NBRC 16725 TaxID=1219035 RepID=U2YP75_9SPHN|nr:class II aldolase/adducin family protein [Caenibius tardaugens]AZI35735.1 class II aldolase/adducin family protein [Caenibius tardaugens NBRC 16725]GAD50710.1 putative aldolase [Caenibius tardaugens NBRC 16725]